MSLENTARKTSRRVESNEECGLGLMMPQIPPFVNHDGKEVNPYWLASQWNE